MRYWVILLFALYLKGGQKIIMKTNVSKHKTKRLLAFFMALLMALTSFPLLAFATDESGDRPEDKQNFGNPFVSGSPSKVYRIPQLVTMNDGTLVAQADARWDAYYDGGGNDSIIARSTNNGGEWTTSMLTYYPDNGNKWDPSSTSICDSALATDGNVLYSLSTFFPAGYALNSSSADHQVSSGVTAFDSSGRLLLSRNGSSLTYYLGEFSSEDYDGRANIYDSSNTQVTGYTVDHDLYLYDSNGTKQGNLFYSDCEFQTAKTNFLMFRSSTDGGKTWSPFKLLNVKNSSEAFYGVGPGRGVVTPNGDIIFGCYTWNGSNSSQRSSFIYSKDGGNTWIRMSNLPELKFWLQYAFTTWTSECQPVLLDDGTIRLFCRSGRNKIIYADAKRDSSGNYYWVEDTPKGEFPVHVDQEINGSNFNISENNQYSVIKYSKQVLWNGNYYDMLIASSANNGSSRSNGTFTFMLLDDNNEIVMATQHQFTYGTFEYSCLTELSDGRIGLLYEYSSDGMGLEFQTYNVEEISGFRVPDLKRTYDLEMVKGDSRTFYVDEGQLSSNSDATIADASFTVQKSSTGKLGTDSSFNGAELPLTNALYTFTQTPDGTWYVGNMGVYLTIDNAQQPSTKDRVPLRINHISNSFYFQLIRDDLNEALYLWRSGDNTYLFDRTTAYGSSYGGTGDGDYSSTLFELYRPAKVNEVTSETDNVPGYIRVSSLDEVEDGEQYLIGCNINGSYYFLYPSLGTTNRYSNTIKSDKSYVDTGWYMTIDALKGGNTTMVCGNTTYNIEVSDYSREITGIVDYDPVIYTQGSEKDITSFGSVIADGSVTGEKYTSYRLNDDSYEILEITPVAGTDNEQPMSDSTIYFDGSKIYGTLNLSNTSSYNSYESGTYVTLKTTLRDSTGMVWTQTDRLYVASSPVPGHVLSGNFAKKQYGNSAALATFLLAEGSYGNTTMTTSDTRTSFIGNANILFNEDGIMTYNGDALNIATFNDAGNRKYAGSIEHSNRSGGAFDLGDKKGEIYNLPTDNTSATIAYYYYDKSSDKNEGITVDPNDSNKFSITFRRQAVDVAYSGSGNGWDRVVTIGGSNRSYIRKLSGDGTIQEKTYMFGAEGDRYYVNDKSLSGAAASIDSTRHFATATADCTTTIQPGQSAALRGQVRYQEGAETDDYDAASCWNDMNLTFEVKMCDKSPERDAYENSISTPRKSTWYTTDSWYNYMQSLLIYQEYLNNYTLLTTDAQRTFNQEVKDKTYQDYLYYETQDGQTSSTIDGSYNYLTKRADFTPLENAIEDNRIAFETGIEDLNNDVSYTPDSFIAFEEAYTAGQNFMSGYTDEDKRNNTAGYEVGPDNEVKSDTQNTIDELAQNINSAELVVAADDSAYVAAKEESERIDLTAYKDNGDAIQEIKDTSDSLIYKEYPENSGKYYVNIPYDIDNGPEDTVADDGQREVNKYTTDLLTEMNVGSKTGSVQVRTFHVDYSVNDEDKQTDETLSGNVTNNDYNYGETAHIDLTQYNSNQYTVKCTVTSETGEKTPTTVNLDDCGYMLSILIQEDITVEVEVTENEVITVEDYYGTVIGMAYIPEGGATVTIDGDNNLIISGTTIAPKQSPRYRFTGWSVNNGETINEETVIRQRGTLNQGAIKYISAINGTVNNKSEYNTPYLDLKLSLVADEGSYWTRTVEDTAGDKHEYLASYDSSFVAFSSNEDVIYTAYDATSLPDTIANQVASSIPAVYGTAYGTDENDSGAYTRFTMSCDYSAPDDVTILDAGVIYSTTASDLDTLVKGGEGTTTIAANRIGHWNDSDNSGTFTMTKTKADTGTHYMRAYVSYTKAYDASTTVPYVAYCDRIFKCENGVITAVN